jgi:hypothetical protein
LRLGYRGWEKWFYQIPQGVGEKRRGHGYSVRITAMFKISRGVLQDRFCYTFLCGAENPQTDLLTRLVRGELRVTIHPALEQMYEEFRPRTIWSLSSAFTSAFKELDPIPQFKATAKLGEFLEERFSQSF